MAKNAERPPGSSQQGTKSCQHDCKSAWKQILSREGLAMTIAQCDPALAAGDPTKLAHTLDLTEIKRNVVESH